jgi:hypothetical protein
MLYYEMIQIIIVLIIEMQTIVIKVMVIFYTFINDHIEMSWQLI